MHLFPLFILILLIPVIVENKSNNQICIVSHNKIEVRSIRRVGFEIDTNESKKKIKKLKKLVLESYNIDENRKLIYERKNICCLILFFSGILGIYTLMAYGSDDIPGFGIINSLYLEYYYKDVKQKILLGCYSKKTILKIKELIPNLIIK